MTANPIPDKVAILLLCCRPALAEMAENFIGRKARVTLRYSSGGLVTTPFIMPRMAGSVGSHGVKHDVAADFQKMTVFLNENSFESSLKEMTDPAMLLVIGLGVYPIELPHSFGQVSIRRFNDQMIVVIHQAISMADQMKSFVDLSKCVQEKFTITIVLEDRFALVSARRDMIKRTVVLNA